MSNNSKSDTLSGLMIIAGIFGLYCNLILYKHSRYYLGEDLIEMSLKIEKSPRYTYTNPSGSRYYFKTAEYPCEFWLSRGAHTIIKDNEVVKNLIEQINPGDSVTVEIRAEDKTLLEESSGTIRVMGLKNNTTRLIQPKMVEKEDKKWFIINNAMSILALLGGIFSFFFKRRNP